MPPGVEIGDGAGHAKGHGAGRGHMYGQERRAEWGRAGAAWSRGRSRGFSGSEDVALAGGSLCGGLEGEVETLDMVDGWVRALGQQQDGCAGVGEAAVGGLLALGGPSLQVASGDPLLVREAWWIRRRRIEWVQRVACMGRAAAAGAAHVGRGATLPLSFRLVIVPACSEGALT